MVVYTNQTHPGGEEWWCDGGGGRGVEWGGSRRGERRMKARDHVGWVDRKKRKLFEAHRKTPSEKFFGGGAAVVAGMVAEMVVGRWPDKRGGRERMRVMCKFEGKADEGFLVGYFVNSKAFRVFNSRTRKVEENLHIKFLENKSNVAGSSPEWLFDIDSLIKSLNYEPVTAGNQTNDDACIETNINAGQAGQEKASDHEYILLPFMPSDSLLSSSNYNSEDKDADDESNKGDEGLDQERIDSSTQDINTTGPSINTASTNINTSSLNINIVSSNDPSMPFLEETGIFDGAYDDEDVIEAIQKELLQFKLQKVWTLVDLPKGKRAIRTKWVYRNKKDKRGNLVRNKARLVAQGYTQEEGIDYDKVFAPVARIEAIRLFLAYASFMGFIVYQMDVKSAFLYGTIEEEVYVCQPPGFEDPQFPDKFYKVEKALYGLHQAPRAWDSPFDLEAFLDSDYSGASLDRKSATRGCQFLGKRLISWQCKKQTVVANSTTKAEYVATANCCGQVLWIQNQMLDYGYSYEKKLIQVIKIHTDHNVVDLLTKDFNISRLDERECIIKKKWVKDQEIPLNPTDIHNYETVIKEWEDRMERAATTASSLEAEQDSGNISRTQSMATLNESFPQGTDSGSGPRCQDTILGGAEAQTREQADTSLVRQNEGNHTETSIRSDLSWFDAEGTDCLPTATSFAKLERMGKNNKRLSKPQKKKSRRKQRKDNGPTKPIPDEAINEEHVATPSVIALETTKSNQALEIESLARRVKSLEKRRKSRTLGFKRLRKVGSASRVESSNDVSFGALEDASKQGRKIADLDADVEVTLVDETQEMNDDNLMFDKEMKRVNTFVDMNTELVKSSETRTEGSSKRGGDELESDNSKK
ncbi:putative ribonuclease H-like domain-containing protein [Tanacetum coccineum]